MIPKRVLFTMFLLSCPGGWRFASKSHVVLAWSSRGGLDRRSTFSSCNRILDYNNSGDKGSLRRRKERTATIAAGPRVNRALRVSPTRNLRTALFSSTADSLHQTNLEQEDLMEEEDTIYALSSGSLVGPTAVAVIRITGPLSHYVLQALCKDNQKLPPPRKAVVRTLYDPQDGTLLDQALVLLFEKPQSFTGEDVVELHCHGSRAVVQGILQAVGRMDGSTVKKSNKIRMAERGEFTQRAFGHGKLDLLGVEALADLLAADTQKQRQQALQQLDGRLSQQYNAWRSTLISGLAHAEAVIDFGDDEMLGDEQEDYSEGQESVWGSVQETIGGLRSEMERHLQDDHRGQLLREGIRIAIVGPPNAGKSSLFNLLARRDAAIVSPIAGTTRDVLELDLDLGGIKCTLSDTAGVREQQTTSDVIELEGMKRAKNVAQQAHITVAMVDATDVERGVSVVDEMLHEQQDNKNVLLVLNKLDLWNDAALQEGGVTPPAVVRGAVELFQGTFIGGTFEISCETSQGVDTFLEALTKMVIDRVSSDSSSNEASEEGALITRERHRQHVQDAVLALKRFEDLAGEGHMAVDMAAEELRLAASELGRITGAVDVEDVLDVLFSDFCIGK